MRIRIQELEPKAYNIMYQFEDYLKASEITATHIELIKMRASQINKCGFCMNMHTKDALKAGESDSRIFMLSMWQVVPQFYSEEERIILQMTEELTVLKDGLSNETYNKAMSLFSPNYVSQIIMAIVVINSWNRIAIATHMEDSCSL